MTRNERMHLAWALLNCHLALAKLRRMRLAGTASPELEHTIFKPQEGP